MQINYHKVILDLEKILDGEVLYDRKTLELHATDASLFKIVPQIVIYPKNKFDISKVVKYVNKLKSEDNEKYQRLSITARAAGTCMSGGSLNDSIILDVTKYLNKIEKLNTHYVVCEPGVYYKDLEKKMDKYNVFLPSYPASKDLCCLGGIVSNNSAGEKTLVYGQTKDWVEEIEVVLANGSIQNFNQISFAQLDDFFVNKDLDDFTKEIFKELKKIIDENEELIQSERPKVSKNSSGYNLWDVINWENNTVDVCKLICGAQGTLGIITKVKLRLAKKKNFTKMLTIFLPSLDKLVPVVEEVLKYSPESLESYDDHTFKIAIEILTYYYLETKGKYMDSPLEFCA
jgi:FAD/FMN-containing dehydrogenase